MTAIAVIKNIKPSFFRQDETMGRDETRSRNEMRGSFSAALELSSLLLYSFFMTNDIKELIRIKDNADNTEALKAAVTLACNLCCTRIVSSGSFGIEIIEPVILPDDERRICVKVYDECVRKIKETDRFFIPEQIERDRPDRQKLIFLHKEFIRSRSRSQIKAQQEGTGFNRLFGSRG